MELPVLSLEEPADLGRNLHQSFLLAVAVVVHPDHQPIHLMADQAAVLYAVAGLVLKV